MVDFSHFDRFNTDNTPRVQRHHGGWILTLGILGFLSAGILGIFAWIWANRDLQLINTGLMDDRGTDLTEYGRILGIISFSLWLIGLAGYFLVHTLSAGALGP